MAQPDSSSQRDDSLAPGDSDDEPGWFVSAARQVATLAMLAYPFVVYFALTGRGPRFAASLLLVFLAPVLFVRLAGRRDRSAGTIALVPLLTAALLAASAVLDDAGFALAVPSAVSAVLLVAFGATLLRGTPMIERFARLQDPDLTPDEVRWCRLWTGIWTGFFAFNGATAGALAAAGMTRAWAVYSGGVAYGLMGLLFASEWTIRKVRFRRLGGSLPERLLRRVLGENDGGGR